MARDELRGIEAAVPDGAVGDRLLGGAGGRGDLLQHVLRGLRVRPIAVGVEVDGPVGRAAVVVGVHGMGSVQAILPATAEAGFAGLAVAIDGGGQGKDVPLAPGRAVEVITESGGVAVVKLVVRGEACRQVLLVGAAIENALLPPIVVEERLLYQPLVVLVVTVRGEKHGAEVEAPATVVHVQLVEHAPSVLVAGVEAVVEAETFPLGLAGVDAHHGLHRGIVAGAGVAHDLHALDVVRRKLVQLRRVTHLAAVDIDFRLPAAKDIHRAFVRRDAGQFVQQVIACAGLFQHTALHGGHLGVAFQPHFGQVGTDGHPVQHLRVGLQHYDAQVGAVC